MNSHPEEEGRCKHENSDFKLWQEIGIIPAALLRYPSTTYNCSIHTSIHFANNLSTFCIDIDQLARGSCLQTNTN